MKRSILIIIIACLVISNLWLVGCNNTEEENGFIKVKLDDSVQTPIIQKFVDYLYFWDEVAKVDYEMEPKVLEYLRKSGDGEHLDQIDAPIPSSVIVTVLKQSDTKKIIKKIKKLDFIKLLVSDIDSDIVSKQPRLKNK